MPGQAGLAFPAMKKLLVLSLACALLAPAALSAADFEGTVSMKMSGREAAAKGGGAVMNFSLKGGLTRMDMDAQGMSVGVIMDPAKQQMTMLMVQQHMYMIRPMATPEAPAGTSAGKAPEMTLEKTSTTEKILGYECVKYVAKDDKGKSTELWLTDQLGSFMGFGSGGRPDGAPRRWRTHAAGLGAIAAGQEPFPDARGVPGRRPGSRAHGSHRRGKEIHAGLSLYRARRLAGHECDDARHGRTRWHAAGHAAPRRELIPPGFLDQLRRP